MIFNLPKYKEQEPDSNPKNKKNKLINSYPFIFRVYFLYINLLFSYHKTNLTTEIIVISTFKETVYQ